jgi:hypothetical protein
MLDLHCVHAFPTAFKRKKMNKRIVVFGEEKVFWPPFAAELKKIY